MLPLTILHNIGVVVREITHHLARLQAYLFDDVYRLRSVIFRACYFSESSLTHAHKGLLIVEYKLYFLQGSNRSPNIA